LRGQSSGAARPQSQDRDWVDARNDRPFGAATVSKDAKYKVDGTDMGFKTIRLVSGKDAASPVQPACKMERPGA